MESHYSWYKAENPQLGLPDLAVICLSVFGLSHYPSHFILQLFQHSILPSATKTFVNNVSSTGNGCYVCSVPLPHLPYMWLSG